MTLDLVSRTYWLCGHRPSDWLRYRWYVGVACTVVGEIAADTAVAVAVADIPVADKFVAHRSVADTATAVGDRGSASRNREKSHSKQA